jgi:adenylate cyclase
VNQVFVKGKSEPVNLYELWSIHSPVTLQLPCREVRKSPRVQVELPLKFKKIANKCIIDKQYNGAIIDLSDSGMLVEIEEPLELFTEIKFSLSLSLMAEQSSDIYGKVVRSEKKQLHHLVNIEFSTIDMQAQRALKIYVDQVLQGI